MTSVDVDGDLR